MIRSRLLDRCILRALKIPYKDIVALFDSLKDFDPEGDNEAVLNKDNKFSCKRSLLAWSMMYVSREKPLYFVGGLICLFVVVPFFFTIYIFS